MYGALCSNMAGCGERPPSTRRTGNPTPTRATVPRRRELSEWTPRAARARLRPTPPVATRTHGATRSLSLLWGGVVRQPAQVPASPGQWAACACVAPTDVRRGGGRDDVPRRDAHALAPPRERDDGCGASPSTSVWLAPSSRSRVFSSSAVGFWGVGMRSAMFM